MIRAIAIDDEPIALDVVRSLSYKVPFLQLLETFTDPFQAVEYLQQHAVDLIFIDIKMPDISGIDLVRGLHHKPHVIFTTAYSEHAITGFELDAVDYLLKPFSMPRFLKACTKVQEWMQRRDEENAVKPVFYYFKSGNDQVRVELESIVYLEATGNYLQIVRDSDSVLTRLTLSEAVNVLPEEVFLRIHRSFVIHKNKINRLERHQLTMSNGAILPIGSAYKSTIAWPQPLSGHYK